MPILYFLILFFLGAAVGSFIGVVVGRGLQGEKISGRSHCLRCGKILAWQDLIPLVSFFVRRGRCRFCQKPIPCELFFIELATGGLFVLTGWLAGASPFLPYWLIAISFGIILFLFDFKASVLPENMILPWILFVLLIGLVFPFLGYNLTPAITSMLVGALVGGGFFALQYLISRGRWVGSGDIYLGAVMGLMLGWPKIFLALFSAYIFGAVVAVGLLATRRVKLSSPIPFGVFLIPALFITLWWGNRIMEWYFSLF